MASFSSSVFSMASFPSHDVYVSFMKLLDPCNDFVFRLSALLDSEGIKTFTHKDVDQSLQAGRVIVPRIFKAIEHSRMSIVIISEKYAVSPRCLSELVKIVECQEKMNQIVLPVFHGVDPSELRKQIGPYANPFAWFKYYEARDTVERWRSSLNKVANMSGYLSTNVGEPMLIEYIVKDIVSRLSFETHKNSGAAIFGDPRNQHIFFKCLEQVAACNGYNDVYSLSKKMSRQRPAITNWVKHEHLGEGSFGSKYKASNANGSFFVVKEFSPKDGYHSREDVMKCLQHLENEIATLAELDHENIVQYYGKEKHGDTVCIFLELVSNGTLENAYKNHRFSEPQVSFYTQQILQGLKYLQDHNVIHRDLKCANRLVNEFGNIKLADFGLAKIIFQRCVYDTRLLCKSSRVLLMFVSMRCAVVIHPGPTSFNLIDLLQHIYGAHSTLCSLCDQ